MRALRTIHGGIVRDSHRKDIDGRPLRPESLSMGYAYHPEWSEGSLKSPIFQTSTFAFSTAEEGKRFFAIAYGLIEESEEQTSDLIYSRINNPDLEILEDRMAMWENTEMGLAFASGMAAITTTLLSFLRPGDVILHSCPLYGGTDHVVNQTLADFDITAVAFDSSMSRPDIEAKLSEEAAGRRLGLVYVETPANPTNDLIDIEMAAAVAAAHTTGDHRPMVVVDNTFLGPLFQKPLEHGADIVLYSATKFLGGHSDLIAGIAVGSRAALKPVAAMRTFTGTMADAWTGWLLMRSLETLDLRMNRQADTAARVAAFLRDHPKVIRVRYLGFLDTGDAQYDLFKRQCSGAGAMISFEVEGGEEGAFRFLNSLSLVSLAVSLGGTESLAEHPYTMTHAGVDPEHKLANGVTPGLVRLSVGVEHPDDLIADLAHALLSV